MSNCFRLLFYTPPPPPNRADTSARGGTAPRGASPHRGGVGRDFKDGGTESIGGGLRGVLSGGFGLQRFAERCLEVSKGPLNPTPWDFRRHLKGGGVRNMGSCRIHRKKMQACVVMLGSSCL